MLINSVLFIIIIITVIIITVIPTLTTTLTTVIQTLINIEQYTEITIADPIIKYFHMKQQISYKSVAFFNKFVISCLQNQ